MEQPSNNEGEDFLSHPYKPWLVKLPAGAWSENTEKDHRETIVYAHFLYVKEKRSGGGMSRYIK